MVRAAIVLLILVLLPPAAHAQKRVALVIGNASYQHAGELTNPKNDANDMAAALRSAGFQVIEGYNLNKAALDRKIRDFATALRGAEAGLFFYAGHGLQVTGQNYIVPVDAELTTEAALDFEMVRLDLVHRAMEREAPTNIIFLDACRNNPLARNLARALGTRSAAIGRGLAAVESGAGTLISFSTQPGNVALDGEGRNSPFAGALVKHLSSSQDDLGSILIAVRNDVMEKTQRRQVPWEHTAMTRRFYFTAPAVALPATTSPQAAQQPPAQQAAPQLPQAPNMTFFVVSAGRGRGADLGGLEGADQHCQQLAQRHGAGGKTWRAYLSTQAADANPAVNARDRIGNGPWQNFKGQIVAKNVDDLHGDNNTLGNTSLTERGTIIPGVGFSPNRHDVLTGSTPEGRAFPAGEDRTCRNWTSSTQGAAMVGHIDRKGLRDDVVSRSWNSSHLSRGPDGGCSQADLRSTGGDGLFYCFAAQ
jgi:Caspase domain